MRVQMSYNAVQTSSCAAFSFGQVEDYTINISLTARMDETASNNAIAFNLYPNPVNGDVLNISNLVTASEYAIFNMMGQQVGKGKIENDSVNVSSLTSGTYLIQVSNENGATSKRFIKQ